MSDVRHSSSRARVTVCASVLAGLLLSGCSLTAQKPATSIADLIHVSAVETKQPATVAENTTANETAKADPLTVASTTATTLPGVEQTAAATSSTRDTAWCRYLVSDAEAQAAILASPTLSASSDDDGNGSVNIGMNLLDFRKAELVRESGAAKCDAHSAGRAIEGSLRLAGESTKQAAAGARHAYLASQSNKIDRIVSRARAMTRSGTLTVQQANSVSQERDKLHAMMNTARAEMEKRSDMPELNRFAYQGSSRQLEEATWRMQSIEQDIRTLDAFDVNLQAGYRFNDGENAVSGQDDYYAKVKVGVRLGALSPNRIRHEEAALEARLDALNEESSGPLWQSRFAEKSISRSLSGMKAARSNLVDARAKARDTAARLSQADRPELVYAALQAEMAAISIGAEVAAADASIRDLEETRRKIGGLSQ